MEKDDWGIGESHRRTATALSTAQNGPLIAGAPRAGRRQNWGDLPDDARAAVCENTGPIDSARSADCGFSSQIAVTLDTARGRVFVKGMRQDHRDAWTQQREAGVNPYVVPLGPRLLWRTVAGGWDLLGFEHLTGGGADYCKASADLPLVVEAMTALGRFPCPDPDVELEETGQRWSAYLDDPADAELFTGAALLHTDWNPTNVLITGAGAAHLVDWPWATADAHFHAWTQRLRDASAQWATWRSGRSSPSAPQFQADA